MKEAPTARLDIEGIAQKEGPVTCLGKTFASDQERREYFTDLLRERLKDPEFRKIEGFPIGEDEDILALSDPPYYTACPNPWIGEFIEEWESQKPPKPEGYRYHREPFAADVSEGKNDPIYKAHSYHTKVPHKAIMRYILHYTEPGDIVFDGFCGTGMTGVAAQLCGDRNVVESLGYRVKDDGTILQQENDEQGRIKWVPFSRLGARKAVMNDLSPAATFIAYNYNTPVDVKEFEMEANRILKEVEEEYGWMYETRHTDGRVGKINYTVWSDVFVCPECNHEVVFWEVAIDKSTEKVKDDFICPYCGIWISKKPANPNLEAHKPMNKRRPISRELSRAFETKFDRTLKNIVKKAKQIPVLINYSVDGKRYEKKPDNFDIKLIEKIESMGNTYWFPSNRLMEGQETRRNDPIGITHVHHFYTPRNLIIMSFLYFMAKNSIKKCVFMVQYASLGFSKISRYVPRHFSQVNQYLSGTLYVASQQVEVSPEYILRNKVKRLASREAVSFGGIQSTSISCQDSKALSCASDSFDYIFIDPPFGYNMNYSELNYIWESWLGVTTDIIPEAIENRFQGKGLEEYRQIMTDCFKEAYRVLKPGRWMTVEFSSTKASVWNSIQNALMEAGFIIANVSALDKKQGSFKAVNTPTAVKQDLVISAYKPNGGFEERFQKEAQTEEGVWDFVGTHLKYLPIAKSHGGLLEMVPERDPRILFDQMVAYFVRKGYPVPLSSQEFQQGLREKFAERDGMYFLPEQVAEYDKKKLMADQTVQISLFVSDEASAIQWLRQMLQEKPQTFQDIQPRFTPLLSNFSKKEAIRDLRELLAQNFLCYDGKGPVPEQIHAYLSTNWRDMRKLPKDDPALVAKAKDRWYVPDPRKAGDLEKLRERALLKEFDEYREVKKKLKVVRIEAVRAGFKQAWQDKDYQTILDVAAKLPRDVLEEDPKLLMWYDQASTRMEV